MLTSQPALEIPFAEEDSDSGLTPVVPTFTGLASQSVPHELLESLERYKLVARLGHGGMAEVFLAAWEVAPFVHRPVVIKRLHEHFTEDQGLVRMFLDEARLLCLLEHPHIVKTLEAGVIEGRCCIAMEYLEGQPLHRVLRRAYQRGKLPLELAVSIAISMLDALDYAHDAKDGSGQALEIVHRDVSPHNVFVTNDGQVKVLDFGIAKAKTQEGRTATGIVKGKVGYIAPEQAAAEVVDRRAHVWSAGVVLWEALTGSRLFKAETDAATLNLTLKGEIPRAATRRPELPAELDVVLARALQRIPALRYGSAAAMKQDLERWLAATGHARDAQPLATLMRDLFESEIIEQRRLVSVLMARSDCTPPNPSSTRTPSSTSALVVTNPSPTSADLTNVHDRVDALNLRHRRAYRTLFALLALCTACAACVAYFALSRASRSSAPTASNREPETTTRVSEPHPHGLPVDSATLGAAREARPPVAPAPLRHAAASNSTPLAQRAVPRATGAPNAASASGKAAAEVAAETAPTEAPSVAPPSTFGYLTIDTSPWSQVSVGGKALGQTPLVGVKLPSGAQVLSLRNPELGIETSYTVTIEAGKTLVAANWHRMSPRIFAVFLLSLLVSAPALASNEGPSTALAAAEQAYQAVDFPATQAQAERALESGGATREQTARLHVLLGISAAALGHADDAKSHFVIALAVDPAWHLDKSLSPKLRDPYLEAQGYWSATGERLVLRATTTADGAHLVVRLRDPASLVAKVELRVNVVGSREHALFGLQPTAVTRFSLPARFRERDYEYVLRALDRFGNVLAESGSDSDPELVRRVTSGDSGSPAPHGARSYLLPVTLGVAGLGAAAVGIVFNAKREQAAHEWNGPRCERAGLTRQQQCESVDSRIQSDERLSVGFYAGGGALLAGSFVALLAGRTAPEPAERASALGCDLTGTGVSCRGQF